MSILVLGSVNVDLVIRGPQLPRPGQTVLGGQFFEAAGGKGANQAVAAARAGRSPVVFVAAVGDDAFGRQALDGLAREGIECRWMRAIPGVATGVALILVDAQGENLISVASGANERLTPQVVEALPEEVFGAARAALTNLESPPDAVERFLRRAKAAGAMTILNPAPALPLDRIQKLVELADVVTPNEHEASLLAGIEVSSPASAAAAAAEIQKAGAASVIVTLGSQGCVVVPSGQPSIVIPPLAVTAVDATAAGDAFSGVLAASLAEGMPLFAAAQRATIAAGLSVTKAGAQPSLPTRAEIESAAARRQPINPCPAG